MVEELEMDPTPAISPSRLERVRDALDQATVETDKMEEEQDRPDSGKG